MKLVAMPVMEACFVVKKCILYIFEALSSLG